MDMDTIKLLLPLGAILVSVVAASTIVKQKLATVTENLSALQKDYESRLRALDQKSDREQNSIELNQQRIEILSSINSPSAMAVSNREIERLCVTTENNSRRLDRLEAMHNGKHSPVT